MHAKAAITNSHIKKLNQIKVLEATVASGAAGE